MPDQNSPPSWWPAKVMMVDTGEIFIAASLEDIPHTRTFKILETRTKEQPNDRPNG